MCLKCDHLRAKCCVQANGWCRSCCVANNIPVPVYAASSSNNQNAAGDGTNADNSQQRQEHDRARPPAVLPMLNIVASSFGENRAVEYLRLSSEGVRRLLQIEATHTLTRAAVKDICDFTRTLGAPVNYVEYCDAFNFLQDNNPCGVRCVFVCSRSTFTIEI